MIHTNAKRVPGQTGMVSIMLTLVMIIIISLIVLGFAQVSRREQRQSLDRQLSAQAFFAAETGVNDAIEAIKGASSLASIEKSDCAVSGGVQYLGKPLQPDINTSNNVSYTCMIVRSSGLKNVIVSVPANGKAAVFPLHPTSGAIDKLQLRWAAESTVTSVAGCKASVPASGQFPKAGGSDWGCPYGILRVDLVSTAAVKRSDLNSAANHKAIFFYPVTSGSNPASSAYSSADGKVLPMYCTTTSCAADITGLGGSSYSMRAMGVYAGGSLNVSARSSAPADLTLEDAQAMIDVTGKAQDVLRRIQVRVSLSSSNDGSSYGIQSASSICKRFNVGLNSFSIPGDIRGQDQNNPMCKAI